MLLLRYCTIYLQITSQSTLAPISRSWYAAVGVNIMISDQIKGMRLLALACQKHHRLCCDIFWRRHIQRSQWYDLYHEHYLLLTKFPKHSYFSPAQLSVEKKSDDEENFLKMKNAYDACLDEDTIKSLGAKPLFKIIDRIREIFPLNVDGVIKKEERKDAITKALLHLANNGISALISAGTAADDRDPDTVIINVSPPWRIGLPSKERYEDEKLVSKYQGVVEEILAVLNPNQARESYRAVVDFEKQLAAASPSQQEREDVTKTYNPMSLKDASDLTPGLDLSQLINKLAPSSYKAKTIIVSSPSYLKKLSEIIDNASDNLLQNYLFWKTIQSLSSYVESDDVLPYKRFSNELAGRDPDSAPERWRTCVNHVDDGLGWILSRFFVEKAFSAKAKKFGDTIVSDIKDQFATTLKKTPWMDKHVIELAINKVHNIVQKIGYPTQASHCLPYS